MPNITAANAVYMLGVASLYPTAQQLQGFGTDSAFDTDASEPAEVMIGVDGFVSAGFVPFLTKQTITLQADSPSVTLFEDWVSAMSAQLEVYYAFGLISLPAISRSYVLSQGVLTSVPQVPGTRKVLQPRNFVITWGSILAQPL